MNAAPADAMNAAARDSPDSLAARLRDAGLDWIVPEWPAPPQVGAFVTTRSGGVSSGPFASLDLGGADTPGATLEIRDAIAENRRRVDAFLPASPLWLEQVHGADVIAVDSGSAAAFRERPPRADAAVTREAGRVLAVRVADCLPVLMSDREGTVVGIAHAGWRGLAAGVVENTVTAMRCDPGSIIAWFGPSIGPVAFEVGQDVHDAFVTEDSNARAAFVAQGAGKWLADLPELARLRLARAGVSAVFGAALCTVCEPHRFFSFRRDRTTGRMAALLWRGRSHGSR